jgi:cytochrome c oxidase subunit 1
MTISAFCLGAAQIPFILNIVLTLAGKLTGERNPWNSTTIEWSSPSPPLPHVNFDEEVTVYHGPYEYSLPGHEEDYCPQTKKIN